MAHDPTVHDPLDSIEDFEGPGEDTVRLPVNRNLGRKLIPTLRVLAGRDLLRFATVAPNDPILIGRDDSADLRLTDATVSKRHARVHCDEEGTITVIDLESTNGTTVDGRPIRRQALRPGDLLEVGAVSLRLDLLSLDEVGHLTRVVTRMEAANRDPLTGLLVRRYLEDELPQLAQRCEQARVPMSCAFIDIDRFKSINDTHGHQVGDDVLRAIGRLMLLGVREADPCVRYGGEEIILFLPGSNEVQAAEVAERIRRAVANHDWQRTAPGLRVTASFGIAELAAHEPIDNWIKRADHALLHAKRTGRNRVVQASGQT